jgi:hypothetical protein
MLLLHTKDAGAAAALPLRLGSWESPGDNLFRGWIDAK